MRAINHNIIGSSEAVANLKKMIELVAGSNSPVIIYGSTGSGKELVAESLHSESRKKGKLIAINCAAIPAELIEAEIFGFEKGSFTGATQQKQGKFEAANDGTLFLDEIGDMPLDVQTKLLRVLESSKITRIGSNKEISINVRVVCATHKNLDELVSQKKFREDLYYRLNVFQIKVPDLKERISDIPELLEHFLSEKKNYKDHVEFNEDAIKFLQTYDWPGNIREVRNVVERAITFFPSQKISGDDVKKYLLTHSSDILDRTREQDLLWEQFETLQEVNLKERQTDTQRIIPKPEDFTSLFDVSNSVDLRVLLRDIEIAMIIAALNRNDNNTSEAAKDLKLQRTTLIEKIKKYGL